MSAGTDQLTEALQAMQELHVKQGVALSAVELVARTAREQIESIMAQLGATMRERDQARAESEQAAKSCDVYVARLTEANQHLSAQLTKTEDHLAAERAGNASLVENVRQLAAEIEHLKAHPWIRVGSGSPIRRVMVDLETFGTRPGSVIVALGAVRFEDGKIVDRYYARIDPMDAQARGLVIDAATVVWWLEQSAEARIEIAASGGKPLVEVLGEFGAWLGEGETEVWGDGASFDNVLLDEAYARCGLKRPWPFWMDRCYRTVKTLWPDVKLERKGTHHNALDDAESQALHLMAMGVGA